MSEINKGSEEKNLYIILTNSLQNDFLEKLDKKFDNVLNEDWKLDYEACQKNWIHFFVENRAKKEPEDLTLDNFFEHLEMNAKKPKYKRKAEDKEQSYHHLIKQFKHRVHVDYSQTKRFWGKKKDQDKENITQFIDLIMKKGDYAYNHPEKNELYYNIHLRDWHNKIDLDQRFEFGQFGFHCLKGSYGAQFIQPLKSYLEKESYQKFNIVINSNSLSSFTDTDLESVLDAIIKNEESSKKNIKIGIFGVITNVKIKLLAFELKVIQKFKKVYVCKDFCGGFSKAGHKSGVNYMKNILGVNVVSKRDFSKAFNLEISR